MFVDGSTIARCFNLRKRLFSFDRTMFSCSFQVWFYFQIDPKRDKDKESVQSRLDRSFVDPSERQRPMFVNRTSSIALIENKVSDLLGQQIVLGSILIGLSVLTVTGNILVLNALRTEKFLRTVSNLFILSLALADLVVGLVVMPLSAVQIIVGRWPFPHLICQIWLSIDYVAR